MLDLTNLNTIKSILKENGLWAKKSFGQNFLVSEQPLITLIKSANIRDDEVVVEVGPGLGTLTQELVKNAKLVLAIEKDYKLVEWLRRYFKHDKKVKIIHEDILRFPISNFQFPISNQIPNPNVKNPKQIGYKIVSNLPYNITSPVIRMFLEAEHQPSEMVLTVQKEVAERICAKPGSSERGILTVMVEFYGQAEIVEIVSRKNFWPSPAVDSAIIKITSKHLNIKTLDSRSFFRIVKIGFSQKRRQIHNPLMAGLHLSKKEIIDILKEADINQTLRAEDLSLNDWTKLTQVLVNR